jgi:hypothetical protein
VTELPKGTAKVKVIAYFTIFDRLLDFYNHDSRVNVSAVGNGESATRDRQAGVLRGPIKVLQGWGLERAGLSSPRCIR